MMETRTGKICPYCQTAFTDDSAVVTCDRCGMPHHAECWRENRRCTTFGCSGRPVGEMLAGIEGVHAAPRSTFRGCPNCGYLLAPDASRCPYCDSLRHHGLPPPPPAAGTSAGHAAVLEQRPHDLPQEYQRWNWGAFGLTFFWTLAMNQAGWAFAYLFLSICSSGFIGLPISIYLGLKGNALAWRSRDWRDLKHFQATQDVWQAWGITLAILQLIAVVVALVMGLSAEFD